MRRDRYHKQVMVPVRVDVRDRLDAARRELAVVGVRSMSDAIRRLLDDREHVDETLSELQRELWKWKLRKVR